MCEMSPVRPGMRIRIIGPATDGDKSRVGQVGEVLHNTSDGAFMTFVKRQAGQLVFYVGNAYPLKSLAVFQGAHHE